MEVHGPRPSATADQEGDPAAETRKGKTNRKDAKK